MIQPRTAITRISNDARATDRAAIVRDWRIGDDGLALRVLAAAVRVKLHERDLLDETAIPDVGSTEPNQVTRDDEEAPR